MIKQKNIKIIYIFICLQALQQYNAIQHQDVTHILRYITPIMISNDIICINKNRMISALNIIHYILYISYTYKQINLILTYKSKTYIIHNKNIYTLYYQYLKKFIYKYQKYYENNIKSKIKKNINDNINNLAIFYLYTLYKILHTKNKFIVYKYIYKNNKQRLFHFSLK